MPRFCIKKVSKSGKVLDTMFCEIEQAGARHMFIKHVHLENVSVSDAYDDLITGEPRDRHTNIHWIKRHEIFPR